MKPLWKKILVTTLALGSYAQVFAAPWPQSLETTASALYFFENPRAELNSQATKEAVQQIKSEVGELLAKQVVRAKQDEFFLPVPFQYGHLNVRLTDAVMLQLTPAFDSKGELDVSGTIGFPALDALNRRWNITKYVKHKFSSYVGLTFDVDHNPRVVADSFAAATAEVKWAEPNQLSFIGGGTSIRRIPPDRKGRNTSPAIYVLNLGWGDCPAGCLALHRRYFEVRPQATTVNVTTIGEAGTPLPADRRAEYYK